jgi:hypothetical protein
MYRLQQQSTQTKRSTGTLGTRRSHGVFSDRPRGSRQGDGEDPHEVRGQTPNSVDKLVDEAKAKRMDGLVNIGTSILGALLGNKSRSGSRTSSAVRDLTSAANKGSDISRAQETLDELVLQKDAMERECIADVERIKRDYSIENLVLEATEIPLRKADTKVKLLALAWVPWQIDAMGNATCLIETIDS